MHAYIITIAQNAKYHVKNASINMGISVWPTVLHSTIIIGYRVNGLYIVFIDMLASAFLHESMRYILYRL